ncbi:MAG: flagellar motor switch protein FliN [Rhodocyclaceae bacterium]|nr:flagellar motor switch protein FliN [Rhodocyclaceae bacterium]
MTPSTETRWLCEQWVAHLGPAISAMTGQPGSACVPEGKSSSPSDSGLLIWRQPFDAAAGAEMWIAVPTSVWQQIGSLVLTSAGLDEADPAETRGTFLEVLQQSLSPLCAVLGNRLRREVQILGGEPMDRLLESSDWMTVEIQLAGQAAGAAWAACNTALLEVLTTPAYRPAAVSEESGTRNTSKTMDLLMEVELPVGVSFGRAQMRLKDAIKLTTGSIVELNRSISEPVAIIVNNCVIARGEVVVVEGNYGVRIKHIVSREERLRTLF